MAEELIVRFGNPVDPRFKGLAGWSITGSQVNLRGASKNKTLAKDAVRKHINQLNNELRFLGKKLCTNERAEARYKRGKKRYTVRYE